MAALLVAMAIMAVMMSVAMPVWKQMAQREKEEELIFRGNQYVHAIALFQRKFANAAPPNIDVLVEQRFLRKKYKDPITNDDFVPVSVLPQPAGTISGTRQATARPGEVAPPPTRGAQPGGAAAGGAQPPAGRATAPRRSTGSVMAPDTRAGAASGIAGGATTGIIGVTSKSKDKSIRTYNGRTHYNEWAFVFVPTMTAPGVGAPGRGVPGTATPGPPGTFLNDLRRGRGRGANPPGGRGTPPPGGRGFTPAPGTPRGPGR
jgi:type II secretory pathway pseudopilin PulG